MTADDEQAIRAAFDGALAMLFAKLRSETHTPDPVPDRLLSVTEAAQALGIGRSAAYTELASERLGSIKVGRRRLVPTSAVRTYIAKAIDDQAR